MCKAFEEIAFEAAKEAAEKAKHDANVQTALKMLALGQMSLETIAQCVDLPLEEIKELAEKKPA